MENIVQNGYDLAMDIVKAFPPKHWKKGNYAKKQYLFKGVKDESDEFWDLKEDIEGAQDQQGLYYYDNIFLIKRIQNPYAYARFILRKKYMKTKNQFVIQTRKYKQIHYKYVDLALKYNCDCRRFGKETANYVFKSSIPRIRHNNVLLVVQVLSTSDVDIECNRDSEFYIEYVVYFDD